MFRSPLQTQWIGFVVAVVVLLLQAQPVSAKPARRPNVVVILADDQGWGDLSIHGNTNLRTPHIDSLARDGALFDRFYVCPVCSPTRAEFLTGRYHPRGGVVGVSTGGERLNLDEKTIGETFKAAGYTTAAFGKWHNGMQYPYHPNARGFGEFYGFCSGHWGNYFSPSLEHNGKLVRGKGFIIDDLTNHGLRFIQQNKNRPFFCYLPFNTPHSPWQVPDRFYKKFAGKKLALRNRDPRREKLPMTRAALAMCENIDWNVGRILKKLDELKLAENTIVIYFSDNGPNSWRWNGGMKGRKGSPDEGGVRVPFLIRWPGHIKPGTKIPNIAGAIDLLPTLANLADVPVASTKPLDGISLKPLLIPSSKRDKAGKASWPDRMIFSNWRGRTSVRTQRFRLDRFGHLFDMTADPGQRHDVSGQHKQIAARLSAELNRWKTELQVRNVDDHRPFTVGYREFPVTHLPARDGVPHGNVKRSARAPNCSFFTNWISTKDRITWDIDLHTTGRYEVVLYYTCPQADVGSTVELSFAGSRIRGKITQAHDPPLHGAEHDRADRGSESLVKDFRPLRLGTMSLKKGRGLLTLRAIDVPGKQVMDIRYVVLTLR